MPQHLLSGTLIESQVTTALWINKMKKEWAYFTGFVFFQIVYAIRAVPYDAISWILLFAGLVLSVVYLKLEIFSSAKKTAK